MEKLGLNEIRRRFLRFFESKDHYVVGSYSLVPKNDNSLLLINAGMAPLKNYFSGLETPPSKRMSTCQKCIRTGDIENVGYTDRHGTFFEMMGNFSFGDYFKKEAVRWSWEFVTKQLNIPEDKIWVTIYQDDDEAFDIWREEVDFPKERIVRLGKEDNFWEIGLGPCGPCSEIYFDRGEKYGCDSPDCRPGCDCDRYLEFWNLVFTQFSKDEDGNYNLLDNKNIDTGMGLERIACIMQDVDSIFEVDTIECILENVEKLTNVKYKDNKDSDVSLRIITDHIRAVSFMISDGVLPSNEGIGYVLRRLLRRAARHGKLLGMEEAFLYKLVDVVVSVSGNAYPELKEKDVYIKKVIRVEEEKFAETLDQGMNILSRFIEELKKTDTKIMTGKKAFKLYDTYGFPVDLTKEILQEEGFTLDEVEFNHEMEEQKKRARDARGNMEEEGWKEDPISKLNIDVKSEFVGYDNLVISDVKVKVIVKGNTIVNDATEGDEVCIVLDKTTFYPEGGGQVGDIGEIKSDGAIVKILDTKKGSKGSIKHIGKVIKGKIKTHDLVEACVDKYNRMASARNHSATHLLHKALKNVLGEHVNQAGSLVTPERLRLDITHFEAITDDELKRIEKKVNEVVLASLDIKCEVMSIDRAKQNGATALFGEKYGDEVRVVTMGNYSSELCGGAHLNNTSQIGLFKILSEGSVAAGIRRIEAITGQEVYNYILNKDNEIEQIGLALKTKEDNIIQKVKFLIEENKNIEKEFRDLKSKISLQSLDSILGSKMDVEGINLITHKFENIDMNTLRNTADNLRDKLKSGVVVLANVADNKVNFIVTATKDLVEKGVHSGDIIKEIASIAKGKGGGRPNMAQAGASDVSKVQEALDSAVRIVRNQIKK